jgi:hypothetical protein
MVINYKLMKKKFYYLFEKFKLLKFSGGAFAPTAFPI